jgi:hypothetical protein
MDRTWRIAVLGIVLATLAAACGPPAGTLFHTTLTTEDGSYSMPVTLGDTTGLVVSMEPGVADPPAGSDASVSTDPANPNVLIVRWFGGACEEETVLGLWPDGDDFGMYVALRGGPGLGGGCPAIGINRAVRITLSSPIAADQITFASSG